MIGERSASTAPSCRRPFVARSPPRWAFPGVPYRTTVPAISVTFPPASVTRRSPAQMSQSLKLAYVFTYKSASPRATIASFTPAE